MLCHICQYATATHGALSDGVQVWVCRECFDYNGASEPTALPEKAVCPNCGQWQDGTSGDCFHECAKRGFAPTSPPGSGMAGLLDEIARGR